MFMVLILVIIIFQMMARWTGVTFEGSTEFAGYAMAATYFFALGTRSWAWCAYQGINLIKLK